MRLRRSDFYLGDCSKRKTWMDFDKIFEPESEPEQLAWWLKRGNPRSVYIIGSKTPFLNWMFAIGMIAEEAKKPMGHQARMTLSFIKATTSPGKKLWLKLLARGFNDQKAIIS